MHSFRSSRPGSAADPSLPHTILVGLPGAGKSTVGSAVAQALGRTFLDVDSEIERREGTTVAAIFAERGEGYFRDRERQITEEVALLGGMIVAPGGGWITRPDTVALVRPPARLIHLAVSPAVALLRMGANRAVRPLLQRADPERELRILLEARAVAYGSADFVVDTERIALQRVIEMVTALASPAG